jgi:GR25 family glycosyltransferase involved in LPS biosynthesis
MEYIDNVYVINLERSKGRLDEFNKHNNLKYKRIDAVDGKKLSRQEKLDAATFLCGNLCSSSVIGIFLSHKKAWQKVVDNGDAFAMIMEDDARIVRGFQDELRMCISELNDKDPEWEFLYVGCFGACSPKRDYDMFEAFMYIFQPRKHPGCVKDLEYSHVPDAAAGFHCYVISNKCARKLLDTLSKVGYHVDIQFLMEQSKFRVYACKKQLAYQGATTEQSTQTVSFPVALNKVFGKYKSKNRVGYDYYLSSPIIVIGDAVVNLYFIAYLIVMIILAVYLKPNEKVYALGIMSTYLIIELGIDPRSYPQVILWSVPLFGLVPLKFLKNK